MLHTTLPPPMLVDEFPLPALGAACLNTLCRSRTLAISVQGRCCDTIARLPSTRAALVIQIQWVINICHHLEGLVTNYYWLGYGKNYY